MKEISKAELSERKNMMKNYEVGLAFMGIKMSPMRVHVGFGSIDHWATIQEIVIAKWSNVAEIGKVCEARGHFNPGIGTPQSKRDR